MVSQGRLDWHSERLNFLHWPEQTRKWDEQPREQPRDQPLQTGLYSCFPSWLTLPQSSRSPLLPKGNFTQFCICTHTCMLDTQQLQQIHSNNIHVCSVFKTYILILSPSGLILLWYFGILRYCRPPITPLLRNCLNNCRKQTEQR